MTLPLEIPKQTGPRQTTKPHETYKRFVGVANLMNMASQLKFFFDAFSQPSRSVWLLLEANSVPFTPSLVNIATGKCYNRERNSTLSEWLIHHMWPSFDSHVYSFTMHCVGDNRTNEEFIKVSPNKTVPAIDDNGFCLFERYFLKFVINIMTFYK